MVNGKRCVTGGIVLSGGMGVARALRGGMKDFLFPFQCMVCGSLRSGEGEPSEGLESGLCPACLARVRRIEGPICPSCGLPGVKIPSRCRRCRGKVHGFRRAAAGAVYDEVVRDLVLALKFRGRRMAAVPLSTWVLAGARRVMEKTSPDAVVAVPLHPARRRSRGYNQAELIAEQVAEALEIPLVNGVVRRIRNTQPQGIGGGGSRRRNVARAFGPVRDTWFALMRGEVPMRAMEGRTVLLVDDVMSTGATLDQCARALLEGGVRSVHAAVAAT